MINEITEIQQHKNIFNKILSLLKRCRDKYISRDIYYLPLIVVNTKVNFKVRARIKLVIDDIITVKERDTVFFCAKIKPKFSDVQGQFTSLKGDLALDLIRQGIRDWRRYFSWLSDSDYDILEYSEGITPGVSDDVIKSTDTYKELTKSFNELQGANFECKLKKDIYKNLTLRDGIVPVMFYNCKKEVFNFPKDSLGKRSSRETYRILYLESSLSTEEMCKNAVKNTPYNEWVDLKFNLKYFTQIE